MDTYRKSPVPPITGDSAGEGASTDCRIRSVGWRDWRELEGLFRRIFPELSSGTISHYIRHYEEAIAVADAGKGLVGFYQFIPRAETRTAWLNYLGVIPSHTSAGVGTLLLRRFEKQAMQLGLCQAEFDVLQQNRRAIRFYEKHGYARLYPVGDKFRYGKSLMESLSSVDASPRRHSFLSRIHRRALYLLFVSLPQRFHKS